MAAPPLTGVITLTADDGVTGQADELVGMAALNGGVVINDTSGVINIDADYGRVSERQLQLYHQ